MRSAPAAPRTAGATARSRPPRAPARREGRRALSGRPAIELEVKLLSPTATLPTRANPGDAGLDLYASEAARLGPGERAAVGCGIAIAVPAGHAGLVLPRSGNAARHGISLVNAPGLIDSGYRGEVRVLLLNTDRDTPFLVETGDRIAQLLVAPFEALPVRSVEVLDETERGAGGFGSSGA